MIDNFWLKLQNWSRGGEFFKRKVFLLNENGIWEGGRKDAEQAIMDLYVSTPQVPKGHIHKK